MGRIPENETPQENSRRRGVIGLTTVAVLVILAVLMASILRGCENAKETSSDKTSAASTSGSPSVAPSWPAAAQAQAEDIARKTTAAYITPQQNLDVWRRQVGNFGTPALRDQLKQQDPQFTKGEVTNVEAQRMDSDSRATYRVKTSTNYWYDVTLVRHDSQVLVTSIVPSWKSDS